MLVRLRDREQSIATLSNTGAYGLDCETTGLRPYQGDVPFAVIISSDTEVYYFNLNAAPDIPEDCVISHEDLVLILRPILSNPYSKWYMHNAKFDLAMLRTLGLEVLGDVHDTEVGARLYENDHLSYSLDACLKRVGHAKDDAVKKYITKHKLWTKTETPSGEEDDKKLHYHRVPITIMQAYAEGDAIATRRLGIYQESNIKETARSLQPNIEFNLDEVLKEEKKFTKTCLRMERQGIRVDGAYCLRGFQYEQEQYRRHKASFEALSSHPFVDSGKSLQRAFDSMGLQYGRTDKGNPSFTSDILQSKRSGLGDLVLQYREHYKKAHTYYQNFIKFQDADGTIHANIRQAGTATGRLSMSEPNLQNLSKEEDTSAPFLIRRAYVPRDGYFFAELDYQAFEYRMMLDEANEPELIEKVIAGIDLHEATAQMMGVARRQAKTLNFMLLYGGGSQKLADALGISLAQAKDLKNLYFKRLPAVRKFIQDLNQTASLRGWVSSWDGRIYRFPDPEFAYKAPNYVIQGGCSSVVKRAMNKIQDFLLTTGVKTKMILQVHDSILLEVANEEVWVVAEVKTIMETTYPYKHLPMKCDVKYSRKSFGDMTDVLEDSLGGKETRDSIQGADSPLPKGSSEHVCDQHPTEVDQGRSGFTTMH